MLEQTVFPRLLLNFDLNGTLILTDSSKKASDDYMLISTLAENTFAVWDEDHGSMSFKHYVYSVLHPGDKSNPQLKRERQKTVSTFLQWLSEKSHPSFNDVLEDYHEIRQKFTDVKTKAVNFTVFPSFYLLLEKLRHMEIPFTIILRTFGSDLHEVVKELEEHSLGLKITRLAKFEDTNLKIGNTTIEKVDEIFDFILNSEEHLAIQDDWVKWNQDAERGRSGKPFLYDLSGSRKVRNLSLFFDDNITGEEHDIVCPYEITGQMPANTLFGNYLFAVNTKEAMLNEHYFIDRVLQALNSDLELKI
jgi:hypothetical protein